MATIRKRNNLWQAQVRLTGFRPRSASFATKSKALAWGLAEEKRLLEGGDKNKDVRSIRGMTLGDLAKAWDEAGGLSKGYVTGFNRLLSDPIASMELTEITKKTAREWRQRNLAKLKPDSLRRYSRVPRGVWEFGTEVLELPLAGNPFSRLVLTKANSRRERRLYPGEYERLKEASRGLLDNALGDVIDWAIETAMRRGEISKAVTFQLRDNGRFLHIPETKTQEKRTVPLTQKAQEIVRERGLLGFTNRLFPYRPQDISRAFQKACRGARINNLRFHDLRHEALSRLNAKNMTPFDMMKVSGHKDVQSLGIYVHTELERIAAIMGS